MRALTGSWSNTKAAAVSGRGWDIRQHRAAIGSNVRVVCNVMHKYCVLFPNPVGAGGGYAEDG